MKKNNFKLITILIVLAIMFVGCTEELVKGDYDYVQNPANIPSGATSISISDTSVISVSASGSVVSDSSLLDWGIVYYTLNNAGTDNITIVSAKDTSYKFTFKVVLSGLLPNTSYLCKTFALNKDGIKYGIELPFKTKPAKSLPFELNATDPVSVWKAIAFTKIDADGDGKGWGLGYLNSAKTEIGLISYSWYNAALTPENYIILPPIQLGSNIATLDLGVEAFDSKFFEEKYKVVISTSPITKVSEAKALKPIYEEVLPAADRTIRTISIPKDYIGKVVWIGICHYDCTDMYALAISSIKVY